MSHIETISKQSACVVHFSPLSLSMYSFDLFFSVSLLIAFCDDITLKMSKVFLSFVGSSPCFRAGAKKPPQNITAGLGERERHTAIN